MARSLWIKVFRTHSFAFFSRKFDTYPRGDQKASARAGVSVTEKSLTKVVYILQGRYEGRIKLVSDSRKFQVCVQSACNPPPSSPPQRRWSRALR